VIAEGESDALAIRSARASSVFDGAERRTFVLGLPGASTWHADWLVWVESFPVVYVMESFYA
jgi:hypothetical protein